MSSFLDRLKARMNNGALSPAGNTDFMPPEQREKSRKVVKTHRWDDRVYKEARKTEPVDNLIEDLMVGDEHRGGARKEFEPAPELVEGLFHSFFKADPVLEKKRNLARELYPVHKILEEMQQNPKLKELQDITANDAVMSTVALDAMGDQVREILSRIPPPPPPPGPGGKPGKGKQPGDEPVEGGCGGGGHPGQPTDEEGDGPDEGQSPGGGKGKPTEQEPGEAPGAPGEGEPDLNDGDTDEFDPDSEDAMNQAEDEWEKEFDNLLDDLDLERMANKMLDAAKNEAEELENLRKGIGLEDGDWESMSPEERLAMAERLRTPEMKALSEVIGQMKRFALGVKATRVNDVPHEAYDVETGNDFRRLLKGSFALLATKETSYEFYRQYADKELLQYKMRGTEEVGKGPIVICIDKSGSMNGAPFRWAMGVAEALRRFASEEDRDYYAMFFGSNNDRHRFEFPGGKAPFEKVLAFLSCVANGGTQFDGVLTEALERASKTYDAEGKGKADIVFVTDGQANLTDEWIKKFNEERERCGVRVFSVFIGGAYDFYGSAPIKLLESFSDAVIPVKELTPEAVKEVFAKV